VLQAVSLTPRLEWPALEFLKLRQSFDSLLVIPYLNAASNPVAAKN
jgi:hypothetical protein